MKKALIIISIIITILVYNKEYDKIQIPENSIRIRVIANSNNIEDQVLKLKVKEKVESKLYEKLDNTKDINIARNKIKSTLPEIENIVNNETNGTNYNINYGDNYFPKKELNGINYKEGNYESLVVTLGDGLGDNWWCVLFPPLCLLEANEDNFDDITYTSYLQELINKY